MSLKTFDSRPWLVLCEGEGDKRLLDKLLSVRNIQIEFQVRFPDRKGTGRGGRSQFGPWLDDARIASGWNNIKGILILSDNDDVPNIAFNEVIASLQKAPGCALPIAERTVAKQVGFPNLVIYMVPTGKPGNLETMCVDAAYSKWPLVVAPLNAFTNTVIPNWTIGPQSKMRLQTTIAATCADRPEAGFVGHWYEKEAYHIPLDHNAFDDLASFLSNFRNFITN